MVTKNPANTIAKGTNPQSTHLTGGCFDDVLNSMVAAIMVHTTPTLQAQNPIGPIGSAIRPLILNTDNMI